MGLIEKKEKNLIELIDRLNSWSLTYSQPNYEIEKIKTEREEILRKKLQIEKKNLDLMREHKYLKNKIKKLQLEVKNKLEIEENFNKEIDELTQETENLVSDIEKWQM